MRVAKDVVDADILVNNGGTSIPRAPRDAAFCKCLYKFRDSFAHNCEHLKDFNFHKYDFYQWTWRLWVNVARQVWRHLNVVTFVEIDVSGRGKASGWH